MPAFEDSFHEVKTLDQGISYIGELIRHTEESRALCDKATTVEAKIVAEQRYHIKYGQAFGALTALCHTRVLTHVAYMNLRASILKTRTPTVTNIVTL